MRFTLSLFVALAIGLFLVSFAMAKEAQPQPAPATKTEVPPAPQKTQTVVTKTTDKIDDLTLAVYKAVGIDVNDSYRSSYGATQELATVKMVVKLVEKFDMGGLDKLVVAQAQHKRGNPLDKLTPRLTRLIDEMIYVVWLNHVSRGECSVKAILFFRRADQWGNPKVDLKCQETLFTELEQLTSWRRDWREHRKVLPTFEEFRDEETWEFIDWQADIGVRTKCTIDDKEEEKRRAGLYGIADWLVGQIAGRDRLTCK